MSIEPSGIAITGLGLLSPFGMGRVVLWEALLTMGLSSPSDVETHCLFKVIDDTLPEAILGPKNLRSLSRESRFAVSAAVLALQDAHWTESCCRGHELGVAMGTAYSGHHEFSQASALVIGGKAQFVNPARTPEAGYNAPASHISIRTNAQGLNVTLASGYSSAFEAMRLGMEEIKAGRLKAILTGGVDVLSKELMTAGAAYLATGNNFALSEASVCLLLEGVHHARNRGAPIAALLKAADVRYSPVEGKKLSDQLERMLRECIAGAGLTPEDVDGVFVSSIGHGERHKAEAAAINRLFGSRIPICDIKALVGECFAASGALIASAAIIALSKNMFPPKAVTSISSEWRPDLTLCNFDSNHFMRHVVVTQLDPTGFAGVLVLGAANGV